MGNLIATIYNFSFAIFSSIPADSSSSPYFLQGVVDSINKNPIYLLIVLIGTIFISLQRIIFPFQKIFSPQEPKVPKGKRELRKKLLKNIQIDINEQRKNTLYDLVQIDIRKEEQRQRKEQKPIELTSEDLAIENNNLFNRLAQVFGLEESWKSKLSSNQKMIEFYDRDDISGRLLILGEPGAGKTTELLSLAKDLVQRAIDNADEPIPVIFNLNSWKEGKSIKDWLREQLPKLYPGLPKEVAEYWLDKKQILPLLDDFDGLEVKQKKCMVAINEFLEDRFEPGLVFCCLQEEYMQYGVELTNLKGAINLLPLNEQQIKRYLRDLNCLYIWEKTIARQPKLKELATNPLFLKIILINTDPKRKFENESEFFSGYINKLKDTDRQDNYSSNEDPSSREQTLYSLSQLAKQPKKQS